MPISGRFYIYMQLFYGSRHGRVVIRVNNRRIAMLQPMNSGTGTGTSYTGGVFNLKAGDYITFVAQYTIEIYMANDHSYFGAFLI